MLFFAEAHEFVNGQWVHFCQSRAIAACHDFFVFCPLFLCQRIRISLVNNCTCDPYTRLGLGLFCKCVVVCSLVSYALFATVVMLWLYVPLIGAEVFATDRPHVIPSVALFNDRVNLWSTNASLLTPGQQRLLDNVRRTVNITGFHSVVFYDDGDCAALLDTLEAELRMRWLRDSFDRATDGRIKSDICRLAMLWKHGGYYFDTDMVVLKNISDFVYPFTRFASCKTTDVFHNPPGFFQSFVAAVPGHKLIKRAMLEHVRWYDTLRSGDAALIRRTTGGAAKPNLGTVFLRSAFEALEGSASVSRFERLGFSYGRRAQLFHEVPLRRLATEGGADVSGLCVPCTETDPCGFAVVDYASGQVLFKSRVRHPDDGRPCSLLCEYNRRCTPQPATQSHTISLSTLLAVHATDVAT